MKGVVKFRIRTNEVDWRHKLTIPALVNFLQETAMYNIGEIGLPMKVLHDKNLGWVLARLHLHVYQHPQEVDEIVIETCAHTFEKYQAYRDFRIYNEKQELICTAASSWLIFDLEKRQLIAIPEFVRNSVSMCKEQTPLFMPKNKLPNLQNIDYQYNYQVRWHDLDANKHVNNTFYFQWILESLPLAILNSFYVEEWDMIFKNECLFGETVAVQTNLVEEIHTEEGEYLMLLHKIIKEKEEKDVVSARVKLKKAV
jgi:medium-chain acyl-[acyl-carrier-protein] hydrolase